LVPKAAAVTSWLAAVFRSFNPKGRTLLAWHTPRCAVVALHDVPDRDADIAFTILASVRLGRLAPAAIEMLTSFGSL
jgi:hypothetical protein